MKYFNTVIQVIFADFIRHFVAPTPITPPSYIGKLRLLKVLNLSTQYALGIYTNGKNKYLVKYWSGKFKDLAYFSLLNEINTYRVLSHTLKSLSLPQKYQTIRLPKLIDSKIAPNSLTLILEYIPRSTSYSSQVSQSQINHIADFLRYLGEHMPVQSRKLLPTRSTKHLFAAFPYYCLLSWLHRRTDLNQICKAFLYFISSMKMFVNQPLVLTHGDLHNSNIICHRKYLYIIDFQFACFTYREVDWANNLFLQVLNSRFSFDLTFITRGLFALLSLRSLAHSPLSSTKISRTQKILEYSLSSTPSSNTSTFTKYPRSAKFLDRFNFAREIYIYKSLARLDFSTSTISFPKLINYGSNYLSLQRIHGTSLAALSSPRQIRVWQKITQFLSSPQFSQLNLPTKTLSYLLVTHTLYWLTAFFKHPQYRRLLFTSLPSFFRSFFSLRHAPKVLVHGDLHGQNVIVQGKSIYVFDLSQATYTFAPLEIASTLSSIYTPSSISDFLLRYLKTIASDPLLSHQYSTCFIHCAIANLATTNDPHKSTRYAHVLDLGNRLSSSNSIVNRSIPKSFSLARYA